MPTSTTGASNAAKQTPASQDRKTLAVTRCSDAWERAYAEAMENTTNEYEAEVIAEEAFLDALPIPIGHEAIANFVACIAFAIVRDIIRQDKATRLLYAAQVALMSHRRKRGPKTSAAEEE